ncbi:MAG TPA: hypothetical protein VKU94_02720 [Geobacterales bacterium]|nr:hypothetical protein [Geobacterales bacterium]
MGEDQLDELSRELLDILKKKGYLSIQEMLDWIKSKKGSTLVLSALISELESKNLIKKSGYWENSEPLFPLPKQIELLKKEESIIKQQPIQEQKVEIKPRNDAEERILDYLARYYSVGELRLRLEMGNKIKEIDPILRSLEERGLIIWDRELGVITASEKLMSNYKRTKNILDVL